MKIIVNNDKPPLLAIKGGKRIFSKPLKPGEEPQKTEIQRESGTKN